MKKLLLTTTAGLSVLAAPLAASAAPYGHWDHDRGNGGAALAAGLFGLVLGAALTSAAHSQPAYAYDDGYYYHQRCGWRTQAYRDYWGRLDYQQVWVCR